MSQTNLEELEEVSLEREELLPKKEDTAEKLNDADISGSSDRYVSDVIKVQIIPEKKGNFLKYTAYKIRSENYKCTVERRYSDFLCLYENFLKIYEYRIIPRLPPKQFMLDSFLEKRRVGLQRWLIIICQHAIIAKDIMLKHFLTEPTFKLAIIPTEFSSVSESSQMMKFSDIDEILSKRNLVRHVLNHMLSVRRLINEQYSRECCLAEDFVELNDILNDVMDTTNDTSLKDITDRVGEISKKCLKNLKAGAIERLELVIEILVGYNDGCDRLFNSNDGGNDKFNAQRMKNMFRANVTFDDEMELHKKRISFGVYCLIDEFKLVKRYLKLLPSILLQFAFQEAQSYSEIAKIFQNIVDIESDKLN